MKKKISREDYRKLLGIWGGNIKDLELPHVRRFPNKVVKRELRWSISSYEMVGGVHYYPHLTLEDNPIWDWKRLCWIKCWDDHDADKPHAPFPRTRFTTRARACRWIERVFNLVNKNGEYKLVNDMYSVSGVAKLRQYAKRGD